VIPKAKNHPNLLAADRNAPFAIRWCFNL
jgi:hypothetical protein